MGGCQNMLRSLPPGQELDGALFRGTLPALLSGQQILQVFVAL